MGQLSSLKLCLLPLVVLLWSCESLGESNEIRPVLLETLKCTTSKEYRDSADKRCFPKFSCAVSWLRIAHDFMDVTDDEDEDADEGKTGVEDIGVEDVQIDRGEVIADLDKTEIFEGIVPHAAQRGFGGLCLKRNQPFDGSL